MPAQNRFFTSIAAEICGYGSRLKQGLCPTCGQDPQPIMLRDEDSRKEFELSGICQTCQDRIFTKEREA